MRVLTSRTAWVASCFAAAAAAADVNLVLDPGPPIGDSPLVVGDFAEASRGVNEHYSLSGSARNDAVVAQHLDVSARADGNVIAGSEQSFLIGAGGVTSFLYDYSLTGHIAPMTVGLNIASPDGTITWVAGVFQAAPQPATVPAASPVAIAMLIAGLLSIGTALLLGRRSDTSPKPSRSSRV